MPDISVLMPCRNALPYLRSSVDSVLRQLGPGDELIVQDAMSGDGSAELLDQLAATEPRLRVRHEPDAGQSDGLNRALARARGELICWLNADDVLLDGALDAVRDAIRAATPELVVGAWELHNAEGGVLRREPAAPLRRPELLLHGCYAFSGAVLVRADVLRRVGGYAGHLHFVMDFDLMLRLAATVTDQVVLPAALAALRYHRDSKSGGQARKFFTEALAVRARTWHGVHEAVLAVAGTAIHAVGVLSARLRYTAGYTRLRAALLDRLEHNTTEVGAR